MDVGKILCIGCVLAVSHANPALAGERWIASDQYGRVHVVVAESASESEQFAAQEFRAYWREATGCEIAVTVSPTPAGVNVWVGGDGVPGRCLAGVDVAGLGTDGLALRSFDATSTTGPCLLIVGGRERGTLYGVYEFFERFMGVRWLTPDLTHIPDAPPEYLPPIDYRFVPPFRRRDGVTYYAYPRDAAERFMRIQRISNHPQFGGPFVHTSFFLLPPDTYFAEHPDWYSEIDGQRRAPVGIDGFYDPAVMARHPEKAAQLCYSNPEVAAALVDVLTPMMRAQPDKRIWSISQMDYRGNCQCAACRAIDEREGTPMGSLLTGINRVADAIKETFPENYIETLAYTYTRKPPKRLKPRDNVIISLCSIECDMARPMASRRSKVNRAFARDVKRWSRIAPNLYFWDYPDTAYHVLTPFPNFHTMQPNMRFWRQHGFTGAFLCGSGGTPVGLGALRGYLLCKLLWNPDADFNRHKREFLDLYYKEAAPYIDQYIEVLTEAAEGSEYPMPCLDPPKWLDYKTVVRAQQALDNARNAARSEEVRERIAATQLQMQYAALVCKPKVEYAKDRFILERPPSITLNDLLEKLGRYPAYIEGYTSWSIPAEMIKAEAGGRTPPRRKEAEICRLENDRFAVWVCPEIAGAILRWTDKEAGRELLEGYERFTEGRSMIHEWDMNPTPQPYPYFPIAYRYTVDSRAPDRLTLQAPVGGFEVIRRMALVDAPPALELEIEVKNATDASLDPRVKLHTEFWTQGPKPVEFWVEDETGWRRAGLNIIEQDVVWLGTFSPREIKRWAYHIPRRRLTVTNEFDGEQVGRLIGMVNTRYEHVIMDLDPVLEPFKPGEIRTLRSSYRISSSRPK